MYLGYNTNGFAFHRLDDAIEILHELGYTGIGLTLDIHHLNPFQDDAHENARRLSTRLEKLGMRCVIETGARYLLDSRQKHQPTLVSAKKRDRERRQEFLLKSIEIAKIMNADAVSFWSGSPDDGAEYLVSFERLFESLAPIVNAAEQNDVRLAFEPEPGMCIETTSQGMQLVKRVSASCFGLTIDVGHVHCLGEGDSSTILKSVGDRLFNIHIEDMRAGIHDHLMFGEGEMVFPPIFDALKAMNYQAGVYVELSRHAHDAVNSARRSMDFLKPLL